MPEAKRSQRPVQPNYAATRPGTPPSRPARALAVAAIIGGAAIFALTPAGGAAASATFRFLEFYSGVFSLVALSLTVMGGLAATDRVVLMVRHRVLLQGVHRSVASASMVFLGIHVLTKIAEGHASVADVIVPFLADHRTFEIGLGTIAAYLMIAVTMTGLMRGRFAGAGRPWLWRLLHASAYACWPIALLHGLHAGRPAKPWVTVSYTLCLVLVGLALMARVWVSRGRQLRSPRTHTSAVLSGSAPATAHEVKVPGQPVPSREAVRAREAVPSREGAPSQVPAARPSAAVRSEALPKPVGRRSNANTDTITDEEFWSYLRSESRE